MNVALQLKILPTPALSRPLSQCLISNFILSGAVQSAIDENHTGNVGTHLYMSPEQVVDDDFIAFGDQRRTTALQ